MEWLRHAAVIVAGVIALGAGQASQGSGLLDGAALLRDLQVLSSDAMQGRQVDTPGGSNARRYLVVRFKASGLEAFGGSYETPFTFAADGRRGAVTHHGVNVVGRVEGRRPSGPVIVVSAHYDHLGVRNGEIFNGADDNASGTAALLALAAYFHSHPPTHSLIFAAFDGEEAGLRGSRAFVANPPVARELIAIDVNMDMIGRDPNSRLFAVGTFLKPFLKPYLERVAATAPVSLLLGHDDPGQREVEDWTRDSDHWAFLEAGIPAVYLGDEDFDQHHKPTDDFETITPRFFVGAAETCLAVVQVFDANLEAVAAAR
jgi:Zn-dependent M28 family amino/carboxypeptidase